MLACSAVGDFRTVLCLAPHLRPVHQMGPCQEYKTPGRAPPDKDHWGTQAVHCNKVMV